MMDLLEGTNLPVCVDIGHANTTGQLDQILDATEGRIMNIHIHDNDGKQDQHLTVGDGNIDFRHVLDKLRGYSGRYVIESKSFESAVDSLDRLNSLA